MTNIPQWKVGDVLSASKLNAMVDAINNLLTEQEVDVSNFITTEQLTTILAGYSDVGHTHSIAEIVDLVLPAVPTKTSQLQNDSDFATNASVDEKIANVATGGQVDLTSYAKKTDLPTKVSQLENDSNFISSIPEEYITEQELNAKGFATETFVTNKIAEASIGGGGEGSTVDLSGLGADLSLNGQTLKLKNANGVEIGTGVTLPQASGGEVVANEVEPAELDVPRVFFYGDALPTTKDNVNLEMDYKSNTTQFHSYIKLKCQGTSSMSYAKKNFTLTMYEDEARSIKLKKNFKGWGKQNKFCLKANWVDSTHTRNISGARIAYDMVASRPDSAFKQELLKCPRNGVVDGFPIKLYFNGEFWGIYTFNIPKDTWMFNMNKDNPNHVVLCAERNTDGNSSLINSCQFRKLWDGVDGGDWSYEVGTPSDATKNSLNRCISFVMNANDQEFHDNIGQYFDLYSLLDYYCFSYVTCHLDGLAKNMLLVTYDGVIWGASLYDMDSIYGVQWNGASFVSPQFQCPEQYQEQFSRLWVRIEECFADELRARYTELRQQALSLTNIIGHVEEIYDLLSPNMKTDETTKWAGIPLYNANTMTRFRNYMKDRVKYTDAEVALIGVFIACESIKLNKTELKMGIFSSESEGGSSSVDDSNVNYAADAQWQPGSLNDDGSLNTTDSNALNDKYCILENLPIGEYTLHHDTFGYKKLCIRAYDGEDGQNTLIGSNMASLNNTNDIIFKISCPDTKVYISVFPNGSQDLSGVTLKRRDLTTSIQDKAYSVNTISQPGWADLGDINNYLLIELKLGSTTEITDVTNIHTVSIGDDVYNVAWSRTGVNGGSHLEKFPSKCATNTAYAGNWYVLLSVPTAKYGKTVAEFKQYCSSNGIENIIVNSIESMSGNTTATTTPIETTWVAGYIKRDTTAVADGTAGTVSVNDVDSTSDYIAVQAGDIIEIKTKLSVGVSIGCVGYDSDKNFVTVFSPNDTGTGIWNSAGITLDYHNTSLRIDCIPETVAYVRICINIRPNDIVSTITSLTLTHYDSTGGNKQLLTYTLRATLTPANTMDKVVWSVSPEGICTVSDKGLVTAVANGDCIITATCGQHSATCNVTVSLPNIECTGISLNKNTLTLGGVGSDTDNLGINLLDGIEWADGDLDLNTGVIKPSSTDKYTELNISTPGKYTLSSTVGYTYKKIILCKTDGTFIYGLGNQNNTYNCSVNISEPCIVRISVYPNNLVWDSSAVSFIGVNFGEAITTDKDVTYTLTASDINVRYVGSEYVFTELFFDRTYDEIVIVKYDGNTYKSLFNPTMAADDMSINKIKNINNLGYNYYGNWDGKSFLFTALPIAYGTTADEILANMTSTTITINPTDELSKLTTSTISSAQLTATVTPENCTQSVVWSVSPEGICTVNNGLVKAKANGECTITATCGQHSVTCNVNVSGIEDQPVREGYTTVVFNGSENWTVPGWNNYTDTSYGVYELNINSYINSTVEFPTTGEDIPTFICDTFEPKTQVVMYNTPQEGICGTVYSAKKLIAVASASFPIKDVAAFKSYLNQNNLVVYFKNK